MLRELWRTARLIFWTAGVLLSFFAVVEIIQAYVALRQVHPAAGWGFLGLLALAGAALLWWYARTMLAHPRALTEVRRPTAEKAELKRVRRYARYLGRYLKRLTRNDALTEPLRELCATHAAALVLKARKANNAEELWTTVDRAEVMGIGPALASLDEQAERICRDCVRSVMFWVALSPYRSGDLVIVIYRNARMIGRLVTLYNSRPALREQLCIFRDTLKIIATVNYIHLGKTLFEEVLAAVPGGRFADEIAQGVGAGFMTSTAGHAAMLRCRAFGGWDEERARERLRGQMHVFYGHVRDMFMKDVFSTMSGRFRAVMQGGQTVDAVRQSLSGALGRVGESIDTYVAQPARAGVNHAGRGVQQLGDHLWNLPGKALGGVKKIFRRR